MTTGALERVVRRGGGGASPGEHCGLCAAALSDAHRHVLDESEGKVMCACRACGLLFEREAAAMGRYRLVPERRLRLSGAPGKEIGAPVGLAFFVRGGDGTVTAHYPSPMGATRWEVDPERWQAAMEGCADLSELKPDVEALLVNTVRGSNHSWIVPIDDCYRLVAIVRQEWVGLSGGRQVWKEIEGFFDRLSRTERRKHG